MIPKETLTVKRYEPGEYVDGYWVDGSTITFNIQTSVQPVKTSELEALPEGRRTSKTYKLYPSIRLVGVNKVLKTSPDIVTIDNEEYEVFEPQPWQNNLINHYKVFVIKIQTEK